MITFLVFAQFLQLNLFEILWSICARLRLRIGGAASANLPQTFEHHDQDEDDYEDDEDEDDDEEDEEDEEDEDDEDDEDD